MASSLTVAGVMSGTSLDAIDVAITVITADVTDGRAANLSMRLISLFTVPWPEEDRGALLAFIHRPDDVTLRQFGELHHRVGRRIAEAVLAAAESAGIAIDIVASHGAVNCAKCQLLVDRRV